MPSQTYIPLANITLSSSDTAVVFQNIPASYRDLVIVTTPLHASGTHGGRVRLNGDSGSNYYYTQVSGDGSNDLSYTGSNTGAANWVAQVTPIQVIHQIMDYSSTNKHKIILGRFARAENTNMEAVRWQNLAAVHTVELNLQGQSFAIGSTICLYGIGS